MLFGFDQYPYSVMDNIFRQVVYFEGKNPDEVVDYTKVVGKLEQYRETNKYLAEKLMGIIEVFD